MIKEIIDSKKIVKSNNEESQLNKNITTKFLLSFTLPTILSMTFISIAGIVDNIFATRAINVEALSVISIVMPYFTISIAVSAMLSMGGSALIAKKKGIGLKQEARENFSLLTIFALGVSVVIMLLSYLLINQLLQLLGTNESIFDLARLYLEPLIWFMPFIVLGSFFTQFIIADGRPGLGMIASMSGILLGTALNAIFLFIFDMGIYSLALATGIGYSLPAIVGLIYFTFNRKKGTIYFVRPQWDIYVIGRSSFNGISEMITLSATAVTTITVNNILMRLVGFEGVAAAGIVLGLQWVFMSMFVGYSVGIAPVFAYNYGKLLKNEKENEIRLQQLFKKSLIVIMILSVIAVLISQIFANLLVRIYVEPGYIKSYLPGYGWVISNIDTYAITVWWLRIASSGFIFMSFNAFATAMFTAFNNGKISGFMSLMRAFVFTLSLIILLPMAFGIDGVWIALPLAELLSFGLTVFYLWKMKNKYHYFK